MMDIETHVINIFNGLDCGLDKISKTQTNLCPILNI